MCKMCRHATLEELDTLAYMSTCVQIPEKMCMSKDGFGSVLPNDGMDEHCKRKLDEKWNYVGPSRR